ncbi:sugar transferase, partial [Streptomyces sp. TRM76130]|nr:sugar transferase [Streptomyces sp. TRM76130]
MTIEVTHEPLDVERGRPSVRRRPWDRKDRTVLLITDGLVAVAAALSVHGAYGRWAVVLALPPAWIAIMLAQRSYDPGVLGLGTEEFRRVVRGAV